MGDCYRPPAVSITRRMGKSEGVLSKTSVELINTPINADSFGIQPLVTYDRVLSTL